MARDATGNGNVAGAAGGPAGADRAVGGPVRQRAGAGDGGPVPSIDAVRLGVLAEYDIAASAAHARVLHRAGLLTDDDLSAGCWRHWRHSMGDVRSGGFGPIADDEDVHTALERGLLERAGRDLGGKLRAGRSRNDQVATCTGCICAMPRRGSSCAELQRASSTRPKRTREWRCRVVRIFSTLSRCCSPTTWLAHAQALVRDIDRIRDWDRRAAVSPYGSGALAGSSLRARSGGRCQGTRLRFAAANSIDGTASRDFAAELAFCLAMVGWTCRGGPRRSSSSPPQSSGMPDFMTRSPPGRRSCRRRRTRTSRSCRGKSGRLIGNLTGLLATLKGLPLAYNRDLQEDKEPLIDSLEQLELLLPALTGLTATLTFDTDAAGHDGRAPVFRWPPTSPNGWSSRASRSGSRTRRPARVWRWPSRPDATWTS